MHEWSLVGNRRLQVNRCWQSLHIELNQLRRVQRKAVALSHHQGQRVAHVAGIVADQNGTLNLVHHTAIGRGHAVHAGKCALTISLPVRLGENRQHPRQGFRIAGANRPDPCVGVGTAHEHREGGAGRHQIVDILSGAG